MRQIEITPVAGTGLAGPLALLEASLRGGEPVPEDFAGHLREAVETGDVEVLVARMEDRLLGVVVLAYHLNVSAGGHFASIEDLYVRPEARRRGVGRALLEAVDKQCASRNISYVEVQVEDDVAESFYAALGYETEPGVLVLSRSLPISDNEMLKPDS